MVRVELDGQLLFQSSSWDDFSRGFRRAVHSAVAEHSPYLFVHCGVVLWKGRALFLPGASGSGKSTLVRELVQRGCQYYSDEYAVIESDSARVYPFPRPLSQRYPRPTDIELPPPQQVTAQVAWVCALTYQDLEPMGISEVSAGQAALVLFRHTVAARTWNHRALELLARVCQQAYCCSGRREEAGQAAEFLLQALPKA